MTIPQLNNYEFELFKKFSSHEAYPIADDWLRQLLTIPGILRGEISGELRRGKFSIEHIDLVMAVDDIQDAHSNILDAVFPIYLEEESEDQLIFLLPSGIRLVIWLTLSTSFASRLLETTGTENHLAQLAQLANRKGFQLNSYGLQTSSRLLQFDQEEEIYGALGIPWIPPELRESGEEVENTSSLDLTSLVKLTDIQSDLHIHTTWSDGKNSIEEMVQAAIQRGLVFIAICDHSPLQIKKNQDDSYFYEQALEIDRIQKNLNQSFTILKGAEVDILPDGSLDLSEDLLKKMDIIVASLHVDLDQPVEKTTTRLIKAIENPYVNIIGHPGGRIYPMVDVTNLDWERVYRAAAYNDVALEINSHKSHPIFDDRKARAAASLGVKIALNSDSHNTSMMFNSRYGIALARRAGLTCEQIINTWSASHLKLWLRQKKNFNSKAR
jgi:DNA polymerase (family 10)